MSIKKRLEQLENRHRFIGHKSVQDMTDSELYEIIKQGHPHLPDSVDEISDEQLERIIRGDEHVT